MPNRGGTSEKATPSSPTETTTGTRGTISTRKAGNRRNEPAIRSRARRPILSTSRPNSGVANMAVSGITLFRNAACSGDAPWASTKMMFANRRNGNTAA